MYAARCGLPGGTGIKSIGQELALQQQPKVWGEGPSASEHSIAHPELQETGLAPLDRA